MAYDFQVPRLGEPKIASPIQYSREYGDDIANYVRDNEFIRYDVGVDGGGADQPVLDRKELLELAGPREYIYFHPEHVHAGIVTCGGLCPGLNDVIRAITRCLWYRYGVRRITGIPFGYQGFLQKADLSPVSMDPAFVDDIHKIGGTVLGSSRGGGERTGEIVDSIERLGLNMLFTIGGDGTQRGAVAIAQEAERRGIELSVVGVPKTIDNDLSFIQKSFGFETAVAVATDVVFGAHAEAHSAINGIGLVKVMGRESGFIAAHTALASHEANFVLIPEVPFELAGDNGFFVHLKKRLERRKHAVILVAEGAGQDLLEAEAGTDASGNKKLADIGVYLKQKIKAYFDRENMEVNLKYIDPSYYVRSARAAPSDSMYCSRLGNNAAHAAMSGRTRCLISLVNNNYVHIPISEAVKERNHVEPEGSLWRDVIEATHQPIQMITE